MSRVIVATTVGLILTTIPFLLLIALVVVLAADLGWWWTILIVIAAYIHALMSSLLAGPIHKTYLNDPTIDPTTAGPSDRRAPTTSQHAFIQSADPQLVRNRRWLALVFPTVMASMAVAGQLLSVHTAVVLIFGFFAFTFAWFTTSLMFTWPLYRHTNRERGMSPRLLLVYAAAFYTMLAIAWLLAIGALVMWVQSSPGSASIWGIGLTLGAALASWKRPLVWKTTSDTSPTPTT